MDPTNARRSTETDLLPTQIDEASAAPPASGHPCPRVINLDGDPSYPKVVVELKAEGRRWLPKGDVVEMVLFINEMLGLKG